MTAVGSPVPHATSPAGLLVPHDFVPGIGGTVKTSDFDLLHRLSPGWVQESFQLGRGPFEGMLNFGQTARIQFAYKAWRPGLLVRGAAPSGSAVLGFPMVDSTAGRIRGAAMASSDLGYLARSEEVDFRTITPFSMFIISLAEEELERYAHAVLGRPLRMLVRSNRIAGGRTVLERQQQVERLGLMSLYRNPARLAEPTVAGWVEERLLDCFVSGLPFAERRHHSPGSASLARRAEDYLLTNLQAPLTIRDLCTAMGASERTLHMAFRMHLDTTPKAHLKTLRLNAARRELLTAPAGTSVMDVAMRWGFFHAGWFSQDYRRLFGESPSKALGSRGTVPSISVSGTFALTPAK